MRSRNFGRSRTVVEIHLTLALAALRSCSPRANPVIVRFEQVNSAGFATSNFAFDELVEVRAPPKAKAAAA